MGTARVVSMSARPLMTSLLCFEVGGILGEVIPQLGNSVSSFDFAGFYSGLGVTAALDPSKLFYNSAAILSAPVVTASLLAALRAEPRKAALDKAVKARQNAYFSKYGSAAVIVTNANNSYGSGASAKPALLQNLATWASQQASLLEAAYTSDGRTGVVRNTNSTLSSTTITKDSSASSGKSTSTTTPDLTTKSSGGQSSTETGSSTDVESGQEAATGQAYAVETESIVNTDYGYRVPYIECEAQNARAQISLIDQQFALFMATQNLPNLATVLTNELSSIDLSIYQLQVGFLNTLLFSPFNGIVTGIYKNPGDPVRAGEPVIRVEDNSQILLVASLIYQGPIQIKGVTPASLVNITTNLFDAGGPTTTLSGPAVAVRNRDNDDLWDVIVQCANPASSGNPTLPIGYHFDYDNTTVTIS